MPEASATAAAPVRISEALVQGRAMLTDSSSPGLDCQLLLGKVTQQSRAWLLAHDDQYLSTTQQQALAALLARRANGEPMAYLLGTQGFWDMELQVSPATLIPRPETEQLVELLQTLPPEPTLKVIDLGTGSGAIAIAISRERPQWDLYATDSSAAALTVARRNAQRWCTTPITFIHTDWLQTFGPASFDVIVANPPYIDPQDTHLPALRYEPTSALVAAANGFADLATIISQAKICLRPGGRLLLEHGYQQQPQLQTLLSDQGFINIQTYTDLNQQPRAIMAQQP
jgi:release factor glutamine methyltransferase